MTVDKNPAWVSDMDSFSIKSGKSGARKLE